MCFKDSGKNAIELRKAIEAEADEFLAGSMKGEPNEVQRTPESCAPLEVVNQLNRLYKPMVDDLHLVRFMHAEKVAGR